MYDKTYILKYFPILLIFLLLFCLSLISCKKENHASPAQTFDIVGEFNSANFRIIGNICMYTKTGKITSIAYIDQYLKRHNNTNFTFNAQTEPDTFPVKLIVAKDGNATITLSNKTANIKLISSSSSTYIFSE